MNLPIELIIGIVAAFALAAAAIGRCTRWPVIHIRIGMSAIAGIGLTALDLATSSLSFNERGGAPEFFGLYSGNVAVPILAGTALGRFLRGRRVT